MKTKKGKFSVKWLYSFLGQERAEVFPMNAIWNSMVPTKVSFFVFLLLGKPLGPRF